MDVKKFERYCELQKEYDERKCDRIENSEKFDEYFNLKLELEKFVFDNQDNKEKLICKLKSALESWRYTIGLGQKAYDSLNELKTIREIMNLIDTYDWKLQYSEYKIKINNDELVKQVSIWEQNSDGQIRNYKSWNVIE